MRALALVRPGVDRLPQLAATANRAHREGIRAALVAGQALLEAKQLVRHGSWSKWLADNVEFSERTARVYMQAARHPEQAGDSLRGVLSALKRPGRWSYVSGDEEWFTPKTIVDATRQVLGTIDLDPSSCQEANTVVRARRYFTIKENGLQQPWRGRVFLNPPYSVKKISLFIEKLVGHVQDRTVTEAIVLVNAETAVKWFKALSGVATAICFPTGRIKFWKPGRAIGQSPLGQAIVYTGRRPKRFERSFRRFGHVWFAE